MEIGRGMDRVEFADIEQLVKFELNEKKPLSLISTLYSDLGLVGDDFDEFLEEYENQFDVNMQGYLWYFHTSEESFLNLFSRIFKTPDKRVSHIPATLEMLRDFANSKKWSVDYPEHYIPKRRYDVISTYIVIILALILIISQAVQI